MKVDDISWEQYQKDIYALADKIDARDFDYVVGIPRGGLVAAVVLSHKLGLPLKYIEMAESGSRVLVVDDLVETGDTLTKTLYKLKSKNISYKFAAIYLKGKWFTKTVDYYVEIKNEEDWILHPFENREQVFMDAENYYKTH